MALRYNRTLSIVWTHLRHLCSQLIYTYIEVLSRNINEPMRRLVQNKSPEAGQFTRWKWIDGHFPKRWTVAKRCWKMVIVSGESANFHAERVLFGVVDISDYAYLLRQKTECAKWMSMPFKKKKMLFRCIHTSKTFLPVIWDLHAFSLYTFVKVLHDEVTFCLFFQVMHFLGICSNETIE